MFDGTNNESNPIIYNVEMNNILLSDAEKVGYDFVSWTMDNIIVTEIDTSLCKDITLTANYTIITYTISYILNGGINSINNPTTYNIETPTILLTPATFEKENVSRWYTEEEFKNRITTITKGSYGNKTLYARAGYDGYDTCVIGNNSVTGLNTTFINEFSITNIIVPEGVTSISSDAFKYKTFITSIELPKSITSLSEGVFRGCSGLESLITPFVGGSADETAASSSTLFGYIFGTISYTGGKLTTQKYSSSNYLEYYIPTSLKSITIIGGSVLYGAFYNCSSLTSITITDGVSSIGEEAFCVCSKLTSITIPSSVTSMGSSAFYGCSGLTSVTFEEGSQLTSIGDYAFRDCSGLTSVTFEEGSQLTSIGNYAFSGCSKLTSVTFEEGSQLTSIGSSAFSRCSSLTSITIPSSVTSIGSSAFYGCSKLTSITIPNSVTSMGSSAFYGCSGLTSVTFEEGSQLTSIGDYAFYYCSGLTSITIPSSVTSIGYSAFYYCSGLTSITIPNSVTSIGDNAFSGCYALVEVYNLSSLSITIGSTSNGSVGCYAKVIHTSSTASSRITNENNIAYYVYGNEKIALDCLDKTLTSISIANDCTSIGIYAFRDCSKLASITIPSSVTSIGSSAFYGCSKLTSVTFENTNGWKLGLSLSSSALSNKATAAEYLRDTYCNWNWKRS